MTWTLLAVAAGCGADHPAAQPSPSQPSASPTVVQSSTVATPTPPSPAVPAAKDGQNYKACVDGTCEVLVRSKAAINLSGDTFTATVAKGTLKLTDSRGYISLSRTGVSSSRSGSGGVGGAAGGIAAASWNDEDGPVHTATLTYAEGDTVIVRFTKG
ncbi:hypothetical protein ACXJJ3_27305 [Kribbella sp. WER1]